MTVHSDLLVAPPGTRHAGLDLLATFRPRMGGDYAAYRNLDAGPGHHRSVSRLSPYIRRRLVTEREVVDAARAAHGEEGAGKFIEEVVWRGYFKGWLEHRPLVWAGYRAGLERDLAAMGADPALRDRVDAAEAGSTGLACFDAWMRELADTGYLHNHARMWAASIWIFTLRLPWRIGADLFLRHLLDGDPASNTLGWRWVAGLHTRGKAYAARPGIIETCTGGRFSPAATDLASDVTPLDAEEPEGLPPVAPPRAVRAPDPALPTALLITEEDCRPEDFDLAALDIRGCATLSGSVLRSPRPVAAAVAEFERSALSDAADRLGRPAVALHAPGANLAAWARASGAAQIVTPYIPEGPLRDWLRPQIAAMDAQGVAFCEMQRAWDLAIWPHATAGFFKVKAQIPGIIAREGGGG